MLIAIHIGLGILGLYFGAEWLVRGSSSLALRWRVSPLLVGLTVVAYGTGAPEMVVSLFAAMQGRSEMAVANALGSNIVNIGLILALTTLILPLRIQSKAVKLDTPVMIAVSVAFCLFFLDKQIARWEALVLLLGLAGYTLLNIFLSRRYDGDPHESSPPQSSIGPPGAWWKDILWSLVGIGLLVAGSELFVKGAIALATVLGWSDAVIGLTVVAVGTSLPELASCLVAACRGQADIAVGNIVGSNIFNLLAIVGVSGTVAGPLTGPGIDPANVYVMLALSILLLPVAWTGLQLQRWEGILLLAGYVGYLIWLWPK